MLYCNNKILITALIVILSACSVPAGVQDVKVAIPEKFSSGVNEKQTWPDANWWQDFNSPELNNLITKAENSNLDIAISIAKIQQADALVKVSGSGLLPTVDLTANASRTKGRNLTNANNNGTISNNFSGDLTASYVLDFWGKNRETKKSAQATANASKYDKQVVVLSTIVSVTDTYFTILALQERLKITKESIAASSSTLEAIKARYKAGIVTRLDVVQQENLVAQQKAAIPGLEQQIKQNTNALALLTGGFPGDVKEPGFKLSNIKIPKVTPGLPSGLITNRPDIGEAEAKLASAKADVQVARANFLPNIELTASGGVGSTALHSIFQPGNTLYSIAVGLTQPVFEGFSLQGQLEYRKAIYNELMQTYAKTILTAFNDVENALVAVEKTSQQQNLQEKSVTAAREAYRLAKTQFEQGTIDITTMLTTQQNLLSAQDSLVQVKLAHMQAEVALVQALGGGMKEMP